LSKRVTRLDSTRPTTEVDHTTVKMGRLARPNPPRVSHLVAQPNPTHLLTSQKNSNPVRPTTVGGLNELAH